MPIVFGFADQRFSRWMASGQSPVFILFFWIFGGSIKSCAHWSGS